MTLGANGEGVIEVVGAVVKPDAWILEKGHVIRVNGEYMLQAKLGWNDSISASELRRIAERLDEMTAIGRQREEDEEV